MIRLIKKYGKWDVGFEPKLTNSGAAELVKLKVAEWLDPSKNKVKKEKVETKKITEE
jgi:hypothetical protein